VHRRPWMAERSRRFALPAPRSRVKMPFALSVGRRPKSKGPTHRRFDFARFASYAHRERFLSCLLRYEQDIAIWTHPQFTKAAACAARFATG